MQAFVVVIGPGHPHGLVTIEDDAVIIARPDGGAHTLSLAGLTGGQALRAIFDSLDEAAQPTPETAH